MKEGIKNGDKQKKGTQHQSLCLPKFFIALGVSVASVTGRLTDSPGEQADTLIEELSTVTVILS